MIPVRLELKNFMSYGEDVPPLDLTGMHTICLSGENGNGKSALLDAITWCLWGESRAGKNRHDELVRIGADEMSVQFTFKMDGLTYRVMRKRSKRASGNQWEFHQQTSDGGWRSLTGNTSAETEQAIQKLLRMSYDTFLNSAYLRQGQADLFVKQPPGKRKEILADILDLTRYDQLEAKARERCRNAGIDVIDIERDINQIDAELASEQVYRDSLATNQASVVDIEQRKSTAAAELDAINKEIGQAQGQKAFADDIGNQARALDAEIGDLKNQILAHSSEQARLQALIAETDVIKKQYADLLEARAERTRLDSEMRRYAKGREVVAKAESDFDIEASNLRGQIDTAVREIAEDDARLKDLSRLNNERNEISGRITKHEGIAARRKQADEDLRALVGRKQKLARENDILVQQIETWDGRLKSLAEQKGVCLVCNAPLPPERAEVVRLEYETERSAAVERRRVVVADGKQINNEIGALEKAIATLDGQLVGAVADHSLQGQLEQRIKDLAAVEKSLPERRKRLLALRQSLEAETFAPELKATREKMRALLKEIDQVPAQHKAAVAHLEELGPAERRHLELERAQAALETEAAALQRDERQLEQRCTARQAIDEQLKGMQGLAAVLAELAGKGLAKQAELNTLQAQERLLVQETGRYTQLIERCEGLRGERRAKDDKLKVASKEQEIYDQIAKAFGKKGVQALIIDQAIPELADEANMLLERLTDGDMSIFFETLREARTKREGPIETLDIKVSDSLGTRPLEMYSGGESFRVAFAMRIALSRLLARRAGARLQTLIIDEGFGTQDGKGREKLVDALNAIKDDFEKIIVITHIDELKDAFATRVEITKTPRGSQITVMEGAAG